MKIRQLVIRSLCLLGLWLGLGLQAHAQTDTVTYVYTDPQGTPLVKADASGNVIARYDYTPYGSSVASLGNPPNGPGYTGHVNDPETGLVYMQARYYQSIGRFLSPDPVGPEAGNVFSFNRYAYVNNNPINKIDPDGRQGDGLFASGFQVVLLGNSGYKMYKNGQISAKQAVVGLTAVGDQWHVDQIRSELRANPAALDRERALGVARAWKEEQDLVKKTGVGTRNWTRDEIKQLLTIGKVKGYEGHHINSVNSRPELAGDPNNIRFETRAEHFESHDNNWRNPTGGDLIDRSGEPKRSSGGVMSAIGRVANEIENKLGNMED